MTSARPTNTESSAGRKFQPPKALFRSTTMQSRVPGSVVTARTLYARFSSVFPSTGRRLCAFAGIWAHTKRTSGTSLRPLSRSSRMCYGRIMQTWSHPRLEECNMGPQGRCEARWVEPGTLCSSQRETAVEDV